MACLETQYRPLPYIQHLHELPRLDFHFDSCNNVTFEPNEVSYWEGVGFWGAILALFGLLLFFGILFYLVCKCCCCRTERDYNVSPKSSSRARCLFLLSAVVAMAIIGAAVYGAAASVVDGKTVIEKGKQGAKKVFQVENEVTGLLKQLDEEVVLPLELLEAQSDIELIQSVLYDLDNVKKELYKVSDKLDEVQVGSTVNFTEKYVNYWEYGILPAVSWMVVVAFIFLLGSCCCTRCFVQLGVLIALLGIIVAFISGAVAFCLALAGSDFCMNPDYYVLHYSANIGPTDTVEYYVCCSEQYESPFQEELNAAFEASEEIESLLTELKEQVENASQVDLVNQAISGFDKGREHLHQIAQALHCQGLHELYVEARTSICDNGILSLIILCGAAMTTSVMFVIVISCGCHLLKKLKQEHEYQDTERMPLTVHDDNNGNTSSYGSYNENHAVDETRVDLPPTYESFVPNDGNDQ
ncbi:protein tweety homolog 2-like isoform X2 [Corticium candelabrum]|uniref:protein tweety homolog 2-like isoform X2 n=1 Tax=Corticium candelabrum TaxID=121492 RepID=UPI002E37F55A|nr:protein tweety homolog 2-like isoform X2 [Corticium candelabrum]